MARRGLLVAALSVLILLAPAAGRAAAPGRADPCFGVVEAMSAPAQATALGVGWERLGFRWSDLQPDGPDSWNQFITPRRSTIAAELAAGRQLAAVLIDTPAWAAADPGLHGASPPKNLYLAWDDPRNYWGRFVGQVVRRYAGRIDEWIIWNEASIPSGPWRTWRGSNADYAQLVKVAYLAAKAANPRATMILGGDPYWYDYGALFSELLRRFSADPGAARHGDYFDAVNLHLYSRPSDVPVVVARYRDMMARYGLRKPIWLSEVNAIPYDDPARRYAPGHFRVTLDEQASFMIQDCALALAAGVERIEINRLRDGPDFRAGGEPFGLVRNDGSLRPAFMAYRAAIALFAGVRDGSQRLDPATGLYTVVLRKPGGTVTVLWDQRPTPVTTSLAVAGPTAIVYDKFGRGHTMRAQGGRVTVTLAGSTGNTNSADPHDYVVGGSPLIVVQPA